MLYHTVYGLLLRTNEAIPGLPIVPSANEVPDVQVHLKSAASPLSKSKLPPETFYVSAMKDDAGKPVLRAGFLSDQEYLVLLYDDGTRFALERHGNEVFAEWPDPLTLEDSAPYLLGPVLGVVLRLREVVPLHASAVSIGDHAVALAGPAGAGKSTTAAAFARRGYRVISDDLVALREGASGFVVPSGYPRVNLWAESVQGVLGENGTLPLISPSWGKYFMPLDPATQFETRSLPLGGIYVLERGETGPRAPIVEQLTGTDSFVAVLRNTYMNHLPDGEKRRREFGLLGRVVTQVPIRRVRIAADLSGLSDLCATIVADVENGLANRGTQKAPQQGAADRIGLTSANLFVY